MLELLEREESLRALDHALGELAAGGGVTALVTGEPGIGKTTLVDRFAERHASAVRLVRGICDELSIPRPLGAFRDAVPAPLGAVAHVLHPGTDVAAFHSSLLEDLQARRRPTVLVLEDVHRADEATVDAITVLGRRLGGQAGCWIVSKNEISASATGSGARAGAKWPTSGSSTT